MYSAFKRLLDVVVSAVVLTLLSPVLLAIAVWIKLDSAGPVLYRGARVGKDGVLFKMCKFRTMVTNADKIGGSSTADDDPRITKIGKRLRKLKLDELPQLLNVVKGEMSFVGPRPEVPYYVEMYSEEEKAILSVMPGITDWASLWNSDEGAILAGSPDPDRTYLEEIRPEKIRLQLEYVRKRSFWTDVTIVIQTLGEIAFGGDRKQSVLPSNLSNIR